MWLDKYKPTDFLDAVDDNGDVKSMSDGDCMHTHFSRSDRLLGPIGFSGTKRTPPTFTSAADLADDDTWFDEDEKCLKWKSEPKHFVVEDENCGVHLVKNALGGRRRDLFAGVMSVQPPYSRNIRDDITVNVIFFGVDVSMDALEAKQSPRLSERFF
jgi:pyruvate dehydrogenase phosphatase